MVRLYGREEPVARARTRVRSVCAGEGGLLLLTGEPGIGKSWLAEHLAALAEAEGAKVVWGRCWEAGGAPSYWPWIQIFRALEMDQDPFAVLPDLGGTAEQARFQVFDLAVRHLKQRAESAPLTLILDDLHAADLPSLLLLLLLAREVRRARILVIGTSRDSETRTVPEVAALLAKIGREGDVLALGRLGIEDVAAWMTTAFPMSTREQAEELFRVTEGHPLFVNEVLRLAPTVTSKNRLLEDLGGMLDERVLALSEPTRTLLEVCAVLGREFSTKNVAAIASLGEDEVEQRLREGVAAGIVNASSQTGSFLFSHVLRRDRLYAELAPSRRTALHWKAGTIMLAGGEDPAAAVHHLLQGHTAGDAERAAAVALEVAEAALERFAFEEVVRLVRQATAVLPTDTRPSRLQAQLCLAQAEALVCMGERRDGQELALRAAETARQQGAVDLLARAALVYAAEMMHGAVDREMVALLREALTATVPSDSLTTARLMARLAAALIPPRSNEDVVEAMKLMGEATTMARRLNDPQTLLYVLQYVVAAAGLTLANEDRASLFEQIVDMAHTLGQRLVLLNHLGSHVGMLLERGRRVQAEVALNELEELLRDFPRSPQHWRLPFARAALHALDGDFVEAIRLSEAARALMNQGGGGRLLFFWAFQQFSLTDLSGDLGVLTAHASDLLALLSPIPFSTMGVAFVLAAIGRREEASRRLREFNFLPTDFASTTPFRVAPFDVASLVLASQVCVLLEDTEMAERLYGPVTTLALSHRVFVGPPAGSFSGPISRFAGELALLTGRVEEAIGHHDEAIAVSRMIGSPALEALSLRARERAVTQRSAAAPSAALASLATPVLEPSVAAAVVPETGKLPLSLRREGDVWAITWGDRPCLRLKHSKGLGYLNYLLEQPGRDVHVLELVGTEHATGDAGPVLDARAKADYRKRLDDLKEELEEAESFRDRGRVERAQEEIEAIAEQLAGAVGLGGRDRRAASDVERARINVQRRLKDAIDRVAIADAGLGRYLTAYVKTGTYCSYTAP